MPPPNPDRCAAIRVALEDHVTRRLGDALAKVGGTDAAAANERKRQQEFFDLQSLLDSSAVCVNQVQMATHIIKGIHPDPKVKVATNLNVDPSSMDDLPLVGSHVLGKDFDVDATGNGAFNKKIFEIYVLLRTAFEGESILNLLKQGDVDAISALHENPVQASRIASALVDVDAARCTHVASHTLAKQIYWPVGDPHDDGNYHLLAPLYPTSLVHRVYRTLRDDRFSENAKAAREARKAGKYHERPVREYQSLAIQKLGGTKPQNISQLNSERRGDNCLLASLPPVWRSESVTPLFGVESLFERFRWRREVRTLTSQMRRFLTADPAGNLETRTRRTDMVDSILDEFMQFTAEVQTLAPGWTSDPQCDLSTAHCAWLDPEAVDAVPRELTDRMAGDFANWLNGQLREPLPMGDPEYQQWCKQALALFKWEEREGNP